MTIPHEMAILAEMLKHHGIYDDVLQAEQEVREIVDKELYKAG